MNVRTSFLLFSAALGLPPSPVFADGAARAPTTDQIRKTVERGLGFLEKDAAAWSKARNCSTCHHGVMTVVALNEARNRGFAVATETMTEMVGWTKRKFVTESLEKPRDPRPGWNVVSLATISLAAGLQSAAKQDALSADELTRIAAYLSRHQEKDGSFVVPLGGSAGPPVFESDETQTLWAMLALPADAKPGTPAREVRDKAAAWLAGNKAADSTQSVALRLWLDVRSGKPAEELRAGIDALLARQNPDGGWSQVKGIAADAFATGQALYVLGRAGVKPDRPEVRRGAAFLIAGQREDGSWKMTSRVGPNGKAPSNPVPITYFGSAWANLGLMQSVAP